ncbi:MAG: 2-hydroxyacid dehydrogenase [Deltaproteobacteria bacterium]|nr:2-hydroxyacid dehydrogenase [Deltaproteobacteria bacterium]
MEASMKPDILQIEPIISDPISSLNNYFTIHNYWEADDSQSFIADLANRIRGIVTHGGIGAGAELIGSLPKLEIISCFGVGVDAIDLDAANAHNVIVTNTPDVLTDDVADLAIALILATAREIPQCDRFIRADRWKEGTMRFGTKVSGKTVGIIGLGRIGHAFAKRAEAFDLSVCYYDPREDPDVGYRHYSDLRTMAADCEFLVLTCIGGQATNNIVNAEILQALGPKGFLINVSRGSTVDESALITALQGGTIAGAGLDVFANEPHLPAELLASDNVVVLPHQGSATHETRNAMGQLVVDNLRAYFEGRPVLTRVA